tara:strand:- start:856 stop:1689 length:834 start_codon:yes stop_codon:yes gene_type:complete
MALGRIISADGNVTSFSYENTQNTLQINNSLTILGPNIIIEFAEGAENADLEAEYINYLNRVSRNPSASLNSFMSHPILSVFRVSTPMNSAGMTFDAASTLEEACALTSPTRIGRVSSNPAVIGSIAFEYYQVDGNVSVWDPINAGTYAMTSSGTKYFITVLGGGYVSSVDICPFALTFDNIAGASFDGPPWLACDVALSNTFGLLAGPSGWPDEWYQLYILDGGDYRPATYNDVEYNSYMTLEFDYDLGQPTPGVRWAVSVGTYDVILVRGNEGQC